MKPLISVIIPVYNVEKYIEKTLHSLANQTLKEYELIIINDASTDFTENVIMAFLSKYTFSYSPVYIKNYSNRGCATSRNIGIRRAKGNYICFLDADDLYNEFFLEKMYTKIICEKSNFIFCGYDTADLLKQKYIKFTDKKKYPSRNNKINIIYCYMRGKLHIGHWAAMYKLSFLREKQIYYYDGCKKAADTEFVLKVLLSCKKLSCIKESLYIYNIRPGSITTSPPTSDIFDGYYAYQRMLKYIKNPLYKFLYILTKYPRETHIILSQFYYSKMELPYLYTTKYEILVHCFLNIIINKKSDAKKICKWFYNSYFKTK